MLTLIFCQPSPVQPVGIDARPAEQESSDSTLQGFLSLSAGHVAFHVGKQFFEVEQSAIGFAVFFQSVLHPELSIPIVQQSLNLSIGEIVDFAGDIVTNNRIRIRNQMIDGRGIQRVRKSVDCRATDIRVVIVEQERDIFFPYQINCEKTLMDLRAMSDFVDERFGIHVVFGDVFSDCVVDLIAFIFSQLPRWRASRLVPARR